MTRFVQQRHRSPWPLARPRELVLVCAPLRSSVNFSRLVRAAACCGVGRVVVCGPARVDPAIARVDEAQVGLERHRSLVPVLQKLKDAGHVLVGLEQASHADSLFDCPFVRRTALIVGNERSGLADEVLQVMDAVVEIPVYGPPLAHNVATAAAMALYEYCRQFPDG